MLYLIAFFLFILILANSTARMILGAIIEWAILLAVVVGILGGLIFGSYWLYKYHIDWIWQGIEAIIGLVIIVAYYLFCVFVNEKFTLWRLKQEYINEALGDRRFLDFLERKGYGPSNFFDDNGRFVRNAVIFKREREEFRRGLVA